MSTVDGPQNYLLSLLSEGDRGLLKDHVERVSLARRTKLYSPNSRPEYCVFIESGIASVIVTSPEGHKTEAGVVGREGMIPVGAYSFDGQMPVEVIMQVQGTGLRVPIPHFRKAFYDSPSLRDIFLRYSQSFFVQCAFTALSNATHHVEERLARWLLICHDRIEGDELPITHEFLSVMLSVRRPSVTIALHVLEGNRLIRSERNLITIRDRTALEEFAHDAYGLPESEYERLIRPLRKTSSQAA